MGRSEGSSAGAIAVVVIGSVLLLLVLGCVGMGVFGAFFLYRSSTPMVQPVAVPAAPNPAPMLSPMESDEAIEVAPPASDSQEPGP